MTALRGFLNRVQEEIEKERERERQNQANQDRPTSLRSAGSTGRDAESRGPSGMSDPRRSDPTITPTGGRDRSAPSDSSFGRLRDAPSPPPPARAGTIAEPARDRTGQGRDTRPRYGQPREFANQPVLSDVSAVEGTPPPRQRHFSVPIMSTSRPHRTRIDGEPAPVNPRIEVIRRRLRSPEGVRTAILLQEILGPPLSMRDQREDF